MVSETVARTGELATTLCCGTFCQDQGDRRSAYNASEKGRCDDRISCTLCRDRWLGRFERIGAYDRGTSAGFSFKGMRRGRGERRRRCSILLCVESNDARLRAVGKLRFQTRWSICRRVCERGEAAMGLC